MTWVQFSVVHDGLNVAHVGWQSYVAVDGELDVIEACEGDWCHKIVRLIATENDPRRVAAGRYCSRNARAVIVAGPVFGNSTGGDGSSQCLRQPVCCFGRRKHARQSELRPEYHVPCCFVVTTGERR